MTTCCRGRELVLPAPCILFPLPPPPLSPPWPLPVHCRHAGQHCPRGSPSQVMPPIVEDQLFAANRLTSHIALEDALAIDWLQIADPLIRSCYDGGHDLRRAASRAMLAGVTSSLNTRLAHNEHLQLWLHQGIQTLASRSAGETLRGIGAPSGRGRGGTRRVWWE
jgi:hypothetical protein